MAELTNKQKAFIEEYLRCWNATEAARRAEYQGNDATLASVGCENLRKPKIASRIQQRLAAKVMSADEVLSRLAEQARVDIGPYMDEDGNLDIGLLKRDGKTHLIKRYEKTKALAGLERVRVETYDAQAALVHLGRHHGLFKDKVEHTGKDGGPIETKDVSDTRDYILSTLCRLADAREKAAVVREPEP